MERKKIVEAAEMLNKTKLADSIVNTKIKDDRDLAESFLCVVDEVLEKDKVDELPVLVKEMYNELVMEMDGAEEEQVEEEPKPKKEEKKEEPKPKKEEKKSAPKKEEKKTTPLITKAKKKPDKNPKATEKANLNKPMKIRTGSRREKQFALLTKSPIKMSELEKKTGETGYSLVKHMVKHGYKVTITKDKEYFLSK